jgi:hypothetical protein
LAQYQSILSDAHENNLEGYLWHFRYSNNNNLYSEYAIGAPYAYSSIFAANFFQNYDNQ